MNKLNIAIICNSYPTNINQTNQIFIKNISNALKSEKVNCDVYYNKIYDYWRDASNYKSIISNIIKYSFFSLTIFKLIKNSRQYDLFNPHGVIMSGFITTILGKLMKKKVVLYIHGGDLDIYPKQKDYYKNIYSYTINHCDFIIVNSAYIKNKVISTFNISLEKIKIISPGVDQNTFFPKKNISELKSSYKIPSNKIILLFVGNAIRRKGLDILIDALCHFSAKELKQIFLIACTEGPELKNIKLKINISTSLSNNIKFIDKMLQTKLNELYNIADVLIFPSREEPLGLVGLESLATGTPVIGSNIGGIPTFLIDSHNGILFQSGNSYDLYLKIKELLNNRLILHSLVTNTKKFSSQYSLHNTAREMKTLFIKLC
ncbi:MAG: hypothetical protein CMG74_06065 [Candidatus Marinimicrobia bacterium]|nr:hypothetical protein [Candidatus Neomarinimicrobiota bacterium]|tara:strand:+ start:3800 stop:4924 length:1125 start_codon:yes stop_codon:yes gene_type:complete